MVINRRSKYLILVFSIVVSLVIAEICMQLFYNAHFVISGWNGQYLDGEEINLHGSRGRKISFSDTNCSKVVLLGDSQVVASASALHEMPEALLEKHLNQNVMCTSIAAGGWGQDQQLLHLKRFFKNEKAELVILWFTPMNDIANNLFPTHFPNNGWAKPTFWLEGEKLRGPNENQNSLIYATPRIHILEPFKLLFSRPFIFNRDEIWEQTRLPSNEQHVSNIPQKIKINSFVDRFEIDSPDHWFHRYENFENGKNSFSMWIDKNSPRLNYGIKLTNKLLHEIRNLCLSNGAKFIIFTAEWQTGYNELPSRKFKQPYEYFRVKDAVYKFSNAAYKRNLKKIMEGLPVIQIKIKMKEWWRSKTDSHLNSNANNEVMNGLAPHIGKLLK
jgi:hypothetical protein